MGEVVEFPKPGPDRDEARLVREARALYENVFPTEKGLAVVKRNTPAQSQEPASATSGAASGQAALMLLRKDSTWTRIVSDCLDNSSDACST